jgi:hypothetical protein
MESPSSTPPQHTNRDRLYERIRLIREPRWIWQMSQEEFAECIERRSIILVPTNITKFTIDSESGLLRPTNGHLLKIHKAEKTINIGSLESRNGRLKLIECKKFESMDEVWTSIQNRYPNYYLLLEVKSISEVVIDSLKPDIIDNVIWTRITTTSEP